MTSALGTAYGEIAALPDYAIQRSARVRSRIAFVSKAFSDLPGTVRLPR